jgi:hypothetical protein
MPTTILPHPDESTMSNSSHEKPSKVKLAASSLGRIPLGRFTRIKITIDQQKKAVREYKPEHSDGPLKGITLSALAEHYAPTEVVHVVGKGYFLEFPSNPPGPSLL